MLCDHSHDKEFGRTSACCQFLYEFHENELIDVDGKKLCPLHAPLEDESGNPTEKENWTDDERENFYTIIKNLCRNATEKQEHLDLSGVIFPSGANFRGMEFPDVDFAYTQFNGGVDFRDTRFRGKSTRFFNTRFRFRADFRETRFYSGKATFRDAQFGEAVDSEIPCLKELSASRMPNSVRVLVSKTPNSQVRVELTSKAPDSKRPPPSRMPNSQQSPTSKTPDSVRMLPSERLDSIKRLYSKMPNSTAKPDFNI